MLVSVVIPAHNGSKYITRCVKSLLKQTYKEIEIIVFNDASTDNTQELMEVLMEQHPDKVFTYSSDTGNGCGGARQEGLKYAKGEYVFFVDCDDYISEKFIENLMHTARGNNYPDIVFAGFTKVDETDKVIYIREFKDSKLALYQDISAWGKLYKHEFLKKNNLRFAYGRVFEDVLLQGPVILAHPTVALAQETGYFYVFNSQSLTNTSLKRFVPGALDQSFEYLKAYKDQKGDSALLDYYAFRYVCWYLLKSGSGVGRSAMKAEYDKGFEYLERYFPGFKKCQYISLFKPKEERSIIRMVLGIINILHKIKLSRVFFCIYGSLKLDKLWPKM